MLTAPFEFRRASTVNEASDLLQQGTEVKLLAGGHSLLPLMKLRLAAPEMGVDISGIPELHGVSVHDGVVTVGAMTRHVEVAQNPVIQAEAPLLSKTAAVIGDVQVRNRGTIGGSLCHADSAADLPAAVLALDAQMVVSGPDGIRKIPASEFFVAPFVTALGAREVLMAVEVPAMPSDAASTYLKRPHPASGYPVIGVACWVGNGGTSVKMAITGIGSTAFRAVEAEAYLTEQGVNASSIGEAARLAAVHAPVEDDVTGYKRQLVNVYVSRALHQTMAGKD